MNSDTETLLSMLRMLKKVGSLTRPNPRRLLHPPSLSLPRQSLNPGTRLFPGQSRKECVPRVVLVWYVEGGERLRTRWGTFSSIREEAHG